MNDNGASPSTESGIEDSYDLALRKTFKWAVSESDIKSKDLASCTKTVCEDDSGIPQMTWKFSLPDCIPEEVPPDVSKRMWFRYDCEVMKGAPAPMYVIRVSALGGQGSSSDKELHKSDFRNNVYGGFLLGSKFLNAYKKAIPEVNGMLVFVINLEFFLPRIVVGRGEVHSSNEIWNKKHEHSTKMRIMEMLKTGELSDVKIISSDGQEFPAHKFILKAGSEVFKVMFDNDMTEARTNVVTMNDMSGKAVRFLLHFIYSSELLPISNVEDSGTATGTSLEEVLHLASKYQLNELTVYLDEIIGKFCNEENSVHLLKLCKLYSLQKGKEMILEFMMKYQGRILKDFMFEYV